MSRKVLLVETNPVLAEFYEDILKEFHFEVLHADNAWVALECAHNVKLDLVISEIHLPEMDGLTFCASLKREAHTRNIPIIMISNQDNTNHRKTALGYGASDFLIKDKAIRQSIHSTLQSLGMVA